MSPVNAAQLAEIGVLTVDQYIILHVQIVETGLSVGRYEYSRPGKKEEMIM